MSRCSITRVRNIPAEQMRLHICWGNYEGPHDHDIALAKVAPILFKAKPMALVIEAANPRHEHEWSLWREVKLPDDKILIPGVLDTSTNYVEHPELVAERHRAICRRGRARAGDRRHRLRLRHLRRLRQARSGDLLQETAGDGRGRGDRLEAAVAEEAAAG